MKLIKLQRVGPLRAFVEIFVLEAFFLLSLLSVADQIPNNAIQLGMMYIGAGCALWYTLRLRLPSGRFWHKIVFELLNTALLGFTVIILIPLITIPFGLWQTVQGGAPIGLGFFLLATCIPGFMGCRILQYGWFFWNRLRQQKLLWGLVHTQLSLIVIIATFGAIFGSILITFEANRNFPEATFAATFAHRIVLTILPFLAVATVGLAATLFVILPPAALASYLFSRRITQRLESLTQTTTALRQGNYAARVMVSGADEVAQLQSNFNAMATELETALVEIQAERDKVNNLLDSQRQLTANVSHELRTPLATIQGYLEPALENPQSADAETLTIIQNETKRLQRLIDDLFTLSRAEVNALKLQIQPTNVVVVVQRIVDSFASLAWQRERVEVVTQLKGQVSPALVDEARLEQILTNLLHNSLRHTPPGGIVAVVVSQVVECTHPSGCIQVEVRDTGEGISPDDLPYIWGRFYRGSEEWKNPQSGAGLGLALVKELTEAMGGTVAAESILGEGSVFTIRLPKA